MLESTTKTKPFKFSFAVSVSQTDFEAVGKGDWKSIMKSIDLMGYDGVELAVRDPDKVSTASIREALDYSGLTLSAIGTGQAFLSDNLSLSSLDTRIRREALNRFIKHMELAGAFGARVIIGLVRGGVTGDSQRHEKRRFFVETLNVLCEKAKSMNVGLLIEPINRYETDLFPTLESAAQLIDEIGSSQIKILMDTFHMNIEEADMCEAVKEYGSMIGHVHLADSNRLAPGKGHIDFGEILKSLKKVDYNDFLSFEILPVPSVEQAAKDAIKHIADILRSQF